MELWNTDTKLGYKIYADMVARLHTFLISANGLGLCVRQGLTAQMIIKQLKFQYNDKIF